MIRPVWKTKASLSVVFFITFPLLSSSSSLLHLHRVYSPLLRCSSLSPSSPKYHHINFSSLLMLTLQSSFMTSKQRSIESSCCCCCLWWNLLLQEQEPQGRLQEKKSVLASPISLFVALFTRIVEAFRLSDTIHIYLWAAATEEGKGKSQNSNVNVTNSSWILPVALLFYIFLLYLTSSYLIAPIPFPSFSSSPL